MESMANIGSPVTGQNGSLGNGSMTPNRPLSHLLDRPSSNSTLAHELASQELLHQHHPPGSPKSQRNKSNSAHKAKLVRSHRAKNRSENKLPRGFKASRRASGPSFESFYAHAQSATTPAVTSYPLPPYAPQNQMQFYAANRLGFNKDNGINQAANQELYAADKYQILSKGFMDTPNGPSRLLLAPLPSVSRGLDTKELLQTRSDRVKRIEKDMPNSATKFNKDFNCDFFMAKQAKLEMIVSKNQEDINSRLDSFEKKMAVIQDAVDVVICELGHFNHT